MCQVKVRHILDVNEQNIKIKKNILGLISHHFAHGNTSETTLLISVLNKDMVYENSIAQGIKLNGFDALIIDKVEFGQYTYAIFTC